MSLTEHTERITTAIREAHKEYVASIVDTKGENFAAAMDTMVTVLGFKTAMDHSFDQSNAPQGFRDHIDTLVGAFADMMINKYFDALGFTAEQGPEILESAQHMVEQLEKIASAEARAASIVV